MTCKRANATQHQVLLNFHEAVNNYHDAVTPQEISDILSAPLVSIMVVLRLVMELIRMHIEHVL